jgi:hypothetical protein
LKEKNEIQISLVSQEEAKVSHLLTTHEPPLLMMPGNTSWQLSIL